MGSFDDIHLEWADRKYTIKRDRVLGAIARVEDVLTLSELSRFHQRGTAPMAKIAMAYGAVLRYAGAKVSDDEVAQGLGEMNADSVVEAIMGLLLMMAPKLSSADKEAAPPVGKEKPTVTASLKKPIKSRSASGK